MTLWFKKYKTKNPDQLLQQRGLLQQNIVKRLRFGCARQREEFSFFPLKKKKENE